jgi:hypothetical protein
MSTVCPMCKSQLADGSRFCHKCGVPLSGEIPRRQAGSAGPITRLLVAGAYLVYVIAWLSCWVAAEAAAVIGLIAVGASLLLIILAVKSRCTWGWRLGAAHCALYLLLFALVVIANLGPREARLPFLSIGGLYLAVVAPLSLRAWRHGPEKQHPMMCIKCGYLLYGLTKPRCPECGTLFDPELLAAQASKQDNPMPMP